MEVDFYPSGLRSSWCLVVEAAGGRNTLEWCWWQVKINTHTQTETEQSTPKLCVAVSGAECRTWHSSIVTDGLQYMLPACPLLLMADLTQSHGLLKWASEWVHNKVIRGEVGGGKWPEGWIRLISSSFVKQCIWFMWPLLPWLMLWQIN